MPQEIRRGRVGKAVITGVGIVDWPASGKPFGVRKSASLALSNHSQEEQQEMSMLRKFYSLLGQAVAEEEAAAGSTAGTETATNVAPTTDETQTDATFKSLLDGVISRVESLEQKFSTSESKLGDLEGTVAKSLEVLKEMAQAHDSGQQTTQKSLSDLTTVLQGLSEQVLKQNKSRPASNDLGSGGNAGGKGLEPGSPEAIYKNSPFDHIFKKLTA